jgi:hypothetical protein
MMRQSYDYPQAMPTFILSSDLLIVNMVERYLRYRTPSTPQTAIAPPHSPKQRSHPLNLPNSDRTPSTPQHPFLTNHSRHRGHREFRAKSQRSKDAKNRTFPQYPFLTNHEDAKNTKEEEKKRAIA